MADFIAPNEGEQYLGKAGIPTTVYFDLSTKSVDSTNPFSETSALATRGAVTGTGYTPKNKTRPAPSGGTFTFGTLTWTTGAATDWPSNVRSVVATSGSAAGTLLFAWNLQVGGGARDMSAASTTENVVPTLVIS